MPSRGSQCIAVRLADAVAMLFLFVRWLLRWLFLLLCLNGTLASAARNSSFCYTRNVALCMATSQPLIIRSRACWAGLVGLAERRRSSAFINETCLPSCLGFCGVLSEKSLPLLGGELGVLSWILRFSITRFGSNGIRPVTAKLFFIIQSL